MAAPMATFRPIPRAAKGKQQMATLVAQEKDYHPNPNYIAKARPSFFNEQYREKVVKYINELAEDFGLLVQTGGIACNYFDRYIPVALSKGAISKRTMQMIASTCLLIAAKFFDRKLPPLSELVIVHNHQATAEHFATLEAAILDALEWKLHVVLPHAFLEPMLQCVPSAPFSPAIEDRMMFFVDLSVYGYKLLRYSPAEVLGSSLLAAWKFSSLNDPIRRFLLPLASACISDEVRMKACTNDLIAYYQVCFPEAYNAQPNKSLFSPIEPIIAPPAADNLKARFLESPLPFTVIKPEVAVDHGARDTSSPTDIMSANLGAPAAERVVPLKPTPKATEPEPTPARPQSAQAEC